MGLMTLHGGQEGVLVKLTTTALLSLRIWLNRDTEETSVSGGVCATGGVGEEVGWEPLAVAEAAIDPRSEDARGEGVVAPDGGGVGSVDVDL
jgi:hypothetical protein